MKVKEQGPSFEDRLKGHLKGQAACTERTELTKRKVLALKPENLVVLRSAAKGDDTAYSTATGPTYALRRTRELMSR